MKRIVLVGKIMRNPEGKAREMSVITDNTIYADSGKTNLTVIERRTFISREF